MKKKKFKNLSLNKHKISTFESTEIKGGNSTIPCIYITSLAVCSLVFGTCDCPNDPIVADPDNTRGCPSWNVAC